MEAHSLRHFFASWLIEQGFNVKRIQTLLGHSSPVVTLTIYAHLMPAEDDPERFAAAKSRWSSDCDMKRHFCSMKTPEGG